MTEQNVLKSAAKNYGFARKTDQSKPSYVHSNIKTLLSLRHSEIRDRLTSLYAT